MKYLASLRPLYELFEQDSNYPDDLFLTSSQAMNMADENSMVVVVDTNRPMMTECEELLKTTKDDRGSGSSQTEQ